MGDERSPNYSDDTERVADVTETPDRAYPMPTVVWSPGPSKPDPVAIGTVLDGKYRVESLLGEGGMGSVLKAEQVALRRPVAIKLMRRDKSLTAIAVERFRREAIALARLKHPHIVTIHDIADSGDLGTYIVMEHVEGESLQAVIMQNGRMEPSRAVSILRQACDAIEAAHRAGVLHRDIKPANIVLEKDGEREIAKVLDFGIADLRDEESGIRLPEGIVGTPHYMAPEQCEGLQADARTDVYALGCTLYAMVVGLPPFADSVGGVTDVFFCQRNVVPVRPSDRVAGLPPALETVILKALSKRPEDRFQTAVELSEALSSLAAPTNLPRPITAFVGREAAVAAATDTVRSSRLVTLFGPGGIGKTRLAIAVASAMGDFFPDGIWVANLETVRDASLVAHEVARVAGVKDRAGATTVQLMREALATRQVLLLLDNCEHVVDAVATFASELLEAAPGVRILATSREALGVRGEAVVPVPVLDLPAAAGSISIGELSRVESVQLFVERARQSRPEFKLTESNASNVAALCRELDGLPLAIELAAARARTLSTAQIRERLSDRFRLLGTSRGAGRQSTLEAAIDWSHELLTAEERELFRRLCVFEGGWSLEAAEALSTAAGLASWDALDGLERLVDKSLVTFENRGEVTRYRMLESIRQYGRRQLEAAGETARWRDWHSSWAIELAERGEKALLGSEARNWLELLEQDHDNARAALRTLRDKGDRASLLRLATALGVFWRVHGYFSDGRLWLAEALAGAAGLSDETISRGHNALGVLAYYQGDVAVARRHLEASVGLCRASADRAALARMLFNLAAIRNGLGEYDAATELYRECLAMFEEAGLSTGVARAINGLGLVAMDCGRNDEARALFERSIGISRQAADQRSVAGTLLNLGTVERRDGNLDLAQGYTESSLRMARDLDDRQLIANAVHGLATVHLDFGDVSRARSRFRDALSMSEQLGAADGIALALDGIAGVASRAGDNERTLRLLGAADSLRADRAIILHPADVAERERIAAVATSELGRERAEAARLAGRCLDSASVAALARAREAGGPDTAPLVGAP